MSVTVGRQPSSEQGQSHPSAGSAVSLLVLRRLGTCSNRARSVRNMAMTLAMSGS